MNPVRLGRSYYREMFAYGSARLSTLAAVF
jgi:hypothetical protein